MSNRDQHLNTVIKAIAAAGGTVDRIEVNKHYKIFWTTPDGRKLIYVTPVSSRSVRGTWIAASQIKRFAKGAA